MNLASAVLELTSASAASDRKRRGHHAAAGSGAAVKVVSLFGGCAPRFCRPDRAREGLGGKMSPKMLQCIQRGKNVQNLRIDPGHSIRAGKGSPSGQVARGRVR